MNTSVYEFISKQTQDPITRRKFCSASKEYFPVFASEREFYEKVSPVFASKKYNIPTPTLSPRERERRRMARRSERNLYKRTCDFSWETIISMFDAKVPFPVYRNKYRWSDAFDPLAYGRDMDYSRPFFEQMHELQSLVPRLHRFSYAEDRLINSEYTNCSGDLKDAYLVFATAASERAMYCDYTMTSEDVVDCLLAKDSKRCYQCINIENCHDLICSQECKSCSKSEYLSDCISCTDCIGCVGLVQKSYCVFNVQYSREEYTHHKEKLFAHGNRFGEEEIQSYQDLLKRVPQRAKITQNTTNSSGSYLRNAKNLHFCYDAANAEDCRYCTWFIDGNNCMDFFARGESQRCYEVSGGGDTCYGNAFVAMIFGSKHLYYCDLCFYCSDCFACVGLKNKQYCIFNKQYTKEEYEIKVAELIEYMETTGEWGEFFPIHYSPYSYNESVAQEYYPLQKDAAQELWYKWMLDVPSLDVPEDMVSIEAKDLPLLPSPEDKSKITSSAIRCQKTGEPFRITPQEFDFYQKMRLPLPKLHWKERQIERLRSRPERDLYLRRCDSCEKDVVSVYPESTQQKVHCGGCRGQSIFG